MDKKSYAGLRIRGVHGEKAPENSAGRSNPERI